MRFFIKEWPDHTATLMTDAGQVIWFFDSVPSAIRGAREWAGSGEEILPSPHLATIPVLDIAA
jgi:hypothetical protein